MPTSPRCSPPTSGATSAARATTPSCGARWSSRWARDGWLGLGWPKEYGGGGAGPFEQLILFTEVQRAGAPFPFVTVNTVGPTLMAYGTPEQKERYLPGILAGEDVWAIGYSEPDAGTDLASLRTRAVRDGDEWVIDGNKVFTSGAGHSDYIWLAVRTDPDAPKHKGISILAVPTSAAWLHLAAAAHGRRQHHVDDLLRRRAGAARQRRSARSTPAGGC